MSPTQKTIKRLERIELNASLLMKEASTLREELSGGSDSSNLRTLSKSQKEKLLSKRRKTQLG